MNEGGGGIFSGLWGAVGQSAGSITGTIFGTAGAGINEATGWADKQRAQQYAINQLQAQTAQAAFAAKQKSTMYIVVGCVMVFLVIVVLIAWRK